MKRATFRTAIAGVAGLGLAMSGVGVAGTAGAATGKLFVSPTGSTSEPGGSCPAAQFNSIQAAVEAAPTGGGVVVCPGTYAESVTIDHRVNLYGLKGAIVDATGQIYGIGIAASFVTVSGLEVENANSTASGAPDDGIITAGFVQGNPVPGNHDTVSNDYVLNNVGSGIDLNSTSYSEAVRDRAIGNGVGINMSNDLGAPASYNQILNNVSNDNPGGCGIALADHTGVGVFKNIVSGNVANGNGLGSPSAPDASAGSGIILADPGPTGGVYQNVVTGNQFDKNGHAGIVIHGHAPGANFDGNVFSRNSIGTNNRRTDTSDLSTTGIYVGDASPVSITIKQNTIHDDVYGVFTAGSVTVVGLSSNQFIRVGTQLQNVPTYP